MAIVILGDLFTFPDGTAATNRVYSYAKGFVEHGINAHVICFRNEYDINADGISNEGINYYHPYNKKLGNKYFIIRQWYKYEKIINTFLVIKKIKKHEQIIGIICYSRLLRTQFITYLLSKFVNSVIFLEVSEHPLREYQGNFFKRIEGKLRTRLATKLSGSIICISEYLIDFYLKIGVSYKKLFWVPSTVDPGRFEISKSLIFDFEYILYCGHLNLKKDGVDILIRSFANIYHKFPEIKLVLIGTGDLKDETILKNIAAELNIQNRVCFLGQMERIMVPMYLKNAKVLALSRPSSIIADAGFPSKLTEYLATGNPVVVTKVGEIDKYLTDNKNAFLSQPGSVEAFSDKLAFVLDNYDFAKKVGLNGKELTSTTFNYNIQAGRIIDIMKSLKHCKQFVTKRL